MMQRLQFVIKFENHGHGYDEVYDKMEDIARQIRKTPRLRNLDCVFQVPSPVDIVVWEGCTDCLSSLRCSKSVTATALVKRENWGNASILRSSYFDMVQATGL